MVAEPHLRGTDLHVCWRPEQERPVPWEVDKALGSRVGEGLPGRGKAVPGWMLWVVRTVEVAMGRRLGVARP